MKFDIDIIPYYPLIVLSIGLVILFIVDMLFNNDKKIRLISNFLFPSSIFIALIIPSFVGSYNPIEVLSLLLTLFIMFTFLHSSSPAKHKINIYALFIGVIGSLLAIQSILFIEVFLGFEFLSLSIYLLIVGSNTEKNISKSLKTYAIWSAITSSIFIFGWGWLFAFSGFYSFEQIIKAKEIYTNQHLIIAIIPMLFSICFKLMLAPIHFWGFTVYKHSSSLTLAFISTIPKITFAFVLLKFINMLNFDISPIIKNIFAVYGILTVLVGVLGVLKKQTLNTLLFHSILAGNGFIILAIWASIQITNTLLFYLFASGTSVIGLILILDLTHKKHSQLSTPKNKFMLFFLKIFSLIGILSIAGLPPTLGFWGKYIVLVETFKNLHQNPLFFALSLLSIMSIIFLIYSWLRELKNIWLRISFLDTQPLLYSHIIPSFILAITIILGIFYF